MYVQGCPLHYVAGFNHKYLHINEVWLEHRRHGGLQVIKAGLGAIARYFHQPDKHRHIRHCCHHTPAKNVPFIANKMKM